MTPFAEMLEQWRPAQTPSWLMAPLAALTKVDEADRLYARLTGGSLVDGLLQQLDIRYQVAECDLAHVPASGAAVVVANHPYGVLDAAVLAALLLQRRPDVKFLTNPWLAALPELASLTIPIDPHGDTKTNAPGLRRALDFLAAGGLLVVFPAGEVAHFDFTAREVCDPPWQPSVARLLRLASRRQTQLAVVPMHVDGRNSLAFQLAGFLHPRLRTAMLLRELLRQRGASPRVRIGRQIAASSLRERTDDEAIAYLRWRTDLLRQRQDFAADTRRPLARAPQESAPLAPPEDPLAIERELAMLPVLGQAGDLLAYEAIAPQIPLTLREIGRCRELSFRAAGEGTGCPADLDRFDRHYTHLFLWDRLRRQIAGAYRLCSTDAGVDQLYTATLFRYEAAFLERLGPAYELGRSFVAPDYQKDFAPLLLLWKAIGRLVLRSPRHCTLFGPVSISNTYRPASRHIMASFLQRFAWGGELASLVTGRHPFAPQVPSLAADIDDLSAAVSDLEQRPAGVPVLLRHYLKLGGKLLGFNLDPDFANVVDGLIVVDLTRTPPRLLQRYLGEVPSFPPRATRCGRQ